MTKKKQIAVILAVFVLTAIFACGILHSKNANERLNKLLENSFYNDELTETQKTESVKDEELSETTQKKEQTETATPETTATETEPPPDEADESAEREETESEITKPPIILETSAETEEVILPGWQDCDENGELLPPYTPQETTTAQIYENEILIIPLDGK